MISVSFVAVWKVALASRTTVVNALVMWVAALAHNTGVIDVISSSTITACNAAQLISRNSRIDKIMLTTLLRLLSVTPMLAFHEANDSPCKPFCKIPRPDSCLVGFMAGQRSVSSSASFGKSPAP